MNPNKMREYLSTVLSNESHKNQGIIKQLNTMLRVWANIPQKRNQTPNKIYSISLHISQ